MRRVRRLLPWLVAGASAAIILTVLVIPEQPGEGFGPGLGPILGVLFDAYVHASGLPAREWVASFSGIGWMLGVLPLVCLTLLLFPTGTVLTPGWRWFGGAAVGGLFVVVVANLVDPAHNDELGLVNPLGVPAMAPWIDPLAHAGMTLVVIGAILRYRLDDIDRIVSRTEHPGDVDPVQAAVDRRFNRTRYDAARIVHDHAQRLRDQVDLSTLVTDLGSTAGETVGATHVSVWINPAKEPS